MVMNGSSSAVCKISTLKVNGREGHDYGSWKPTGKTHKIRTQDRKNTLGLKKILVFKKRESPKNAHTKWVLHEYSILNDQSDFVLYHLKKSPDENDKKNSDCCFSFLLCLKSSVRRRPIPSAISE